MQRVWRLNFDADLELGARGGYSPARDVAARQHEIAARARGLVPDGDLMVDDAGLVVGPSRLREPLTEGRAFCPTPRARRAWQLAGAAVPICPALEVLRRVNHRLFCSELGPTLPHAKFCHSMAELSSVLASGGPHWLLKRAFGFAGRGQRRVLGATLDDTSRRFAARSFSADHGLQVEPLVERLLDVGLHGFLAPNGALTLGEPTLQTIDDRGSWVDTARTSAGDLEPRERAELLSEGHRVALALRAAGYFGPFGIDAFRWRAPDGGAQFNPRCDINARYSMGWATGMADRRPDLDG